MVKKPKYYDSKKCDNIRSMLRSSERLFGSRVAFMQKENGAYQETTYSEYRDMVEELGTELYARGYAGSRIIVMGDNSLEWATVYMATVCGLGVIVPVDKEIPDEELQNIARLSEARAIFCSSHLKEKADKVGIDTFTFDDIYSLIASGAKRLKCGERDYLRLPINNDAMAILIFTSGTTGVSKGVMLSNRNICYTLSEIGTMIQADCTDRVLSVLPMHHIYEATCGFLFVLSIGGSIAFAEGLRYITRNIQEVKPTAMFCVPILLETIYHKIWANIKRKGIERKVRNAIKLTGKNMKLKRRVFSEIHDSLGGNLRLIVSGGAAADPMVIKGMRDLGFLTLQGYGLTECAPIAAVNKDDFYRDDAAGLATPHSVLDVYDVQNDGTGEIRVKGDNVMLGYYGDPELTAKTIRGGWLYTGDLGYIDTDGFLHITGRKKNVIVTAGGKNVFPEELETYLCRSEFVDDAVVVGYVNEAKGDYDIVAVLYPNEAAFTETYGRGYSQGQVEAEFAKAIEDTNSLVQDYKRIHFFVTRQEKFDKNSSRKIRRAGVAEEAHAEYLRKLARK